MLPVPPVVTIPAGCAPSTAEACRRSRSIAMTSPSNRVAEGDRSRCSALAWANPPNASVRNA